MLEDLSPQEIQPSLSLLIKYISVDRPVQFIVSIQPLNGDRWYWGAALLRSTTICLVSAVDGLPCSLPQRCPPGSCIHHPAHP